MRAGACVLQAWMGWLVCLLACLQCVSSVTLSQHGEQLAFPLDPERAADHLIALLSFAEAALRCTATV